MDSTKTTQPRTKRLRALSNTQQWLIVNSVGIATFVCATITFFSQNPCAERQLLKHLSMLLRGH